MKKTKKEQELANFQSKRLLLVIHKYIEVWFLLKLETLIWVNTTIIHRVTDCSDLDQIEQIISVLEVVRKDTYNVIGSISFWGLSWMKAVPIMSEKGFTASIYSIGDRPLPSKIFEWTVNDTAKNIIAQQEAAKKAVIAKIYQGFPISESPNLTDEQKSINKQNLAVRKEWCKALTDGSFLKIPRLHRWVRLEYKRGHCRQNRQIVYQGQAYKCKRINRYTVQLSIQSATPRVPIILTVRTNRIITGQIRVICSGAGNLEIHNLETLMNLGYFKLLNRDSEIGVDRGYTEVFATSTGMMLGDGFGKQLTRKTDRITLIGQRKNKLWSLANVKFKNKNRIKASRILENNLRNKTELKRRNRDDAYVETIVNQSVKIATFLTDHLIYEDLTDNIPDRRKQISRRAKNRLHHWQKGTVVERLQVWANRNHTHLTSVNCAYSSQVDAVTGTLLGSRNGDRFIRYTGVELQADQNAAEVIRLRAHDREITRYMKFNEVQYVLLCRTKAFLKTLGLSLQDAVSRRWLDSKHTHHKRYKELLLG